VNRIVSQLGVSMRKIRKYRFPI